MSVEQRMSAWEARRQFGKLLRDVSRTNTAVVVESHGDEVAVVISVEEYQRLQRIKREAFDRFQSIAGSVNASEAEADALGNEASEWARQQPG